MWRSKKIEEDLAIFK